MRVLAIHSKYRHVGGEDISFSTEANLLRSQGLQVDEYVVSSSEMAQMSPLSQARAAMKGDRDLKQRLLRRLEATDPDVVYLNNWFPWLAPLVGDFADRTPTLVAVRNYRLSCINGLMRRNGTDCCLCSERGRWAGVLHGCYEGRAQSIAATVSASKASSSLRSRANVHFAAISAFVENYLLTQGIPRNRVHHKPNGVYPAPEPGSGGDGVLFVGRLEPEKGFSTFMEAARRTGIRPVVVGSGSMTAQAQASTADYRGELAHEDALRIMATSRVTVVPSEWDEPFGRVAAESLACGTPVITSDRGGLASIGDPSCCIVVGSGNTEQLAAAMLETTTDRYWAGPAREASRICFQKRYAAAPVSRALIQALEQTRAGWTDAGGAPESHGRRSPHD